MRKVFISHSSLNTWAIDELINLIESVNPKASVFCSSSLYSTGIPIKPGENYKKTIYTNLRDADVFVAIISQEYWDSRYCILELGAAYQRYFNESNTVSIQPMLLPPLARRLALANTPLAEMQVTNLIDPQAIALFLHKLEEPDVGMSVDQLEPRIARYASSIHRHVLAQTSITDGADANAYFDERSDCHLSREQVVRCLSLDNGGYLFEFHLSQPPYTPSFASIALEYWEEMNLRDYLLFDRKASFCFDLDNNGGPLKAITVEFKVGETHKVYHAIDCPLVEGKNTISISLSDMDKKPLSEINQICFVVHPEEMHTPDGEVTISNIKVVFAEKNLFDDANREE